MTEKFQEYKIPIRLGIDDINYYPGLESEWWTEEQWKAYRDDLPARKERDRLYVEKLRTEGRYGITENLVIKLQYNPAFDIPQLSTNTPLTSHRMVFLNDEKQEL